MPNLYRLQEFANITKNENAIAIINTYFETLKWSNGCYYLGGHIAMKPDEIITPQIIKETQSLLYYNMGHSWGDMDLMNDLTQTEFNIIIQLIEDINLQKLCMNGLLKVIVFWLSPARKRAAEKVFHPSKMKYLYYD